jgi:hypothetical protein
MIKNLHMQNCKWHYDESDKIIDDCWYDNCDVDTTHGHSGQATFRVTGGRIGNTNNLSATRQSYTNVKFNGGLTQNWPPELNLDAYNPNNLVVLESCTFLGTRAPTILERDMRTMVVTIGRNGVSLVSGTRIKADKKNNTLPIAPAHEVIKNKWGINHSIKINGSWRAGAKLTSISGDANFIYADFSGVTLTNGMEIYVAGCQRMEVRNCTGTGLTRRDFENTPEIVWTNNT